MKLIIVFVLVELADIFTTVTGMWLFGFKEGNPFMRSLAIEQMLSIKILATILVAFCLYKFKFVGKLAWVLPILASLPVIWNITLIIARLI